MILLFSHKRTPEQIADAKSSFGVEEFLTIDDELQNICSNIPVDLEDIEEYL